MEQLFSNLSGDIEFIKKYGVWIAVVAGLLVVLLIIAIARTV